MKRDIEKLDMGQAEAYRPRAACYRDERLSRPILKHQDFVTVLFYGKKIEKTQLPFAKKHFDRTISHAEARARDVFPGYP
jgi:hypothetical protein